MASIKGVVLFLLIITGVSGLAAPTTQWNTYRAAVQNSGLQDISGDVSRLIKVPVYTIYFTFPQASMTLNTSATANQIRSDIASLTTCTFLEWTSLSSLLQSTLLLRCGDWDDISPLLLSSSTIRTYGTDIAHWSTQTTRERFSAREAFRPPTPATAQPTVSPTASAQPTVQKRQENKFPFNWTWPGYDPWTFDSSVTCSVHGSNMNSQLGFDTDPRQWGFSSVTQNNPPLLFGTSRERRYPYLGRAGKFYIADSGVDAQHPEFLYKVNGNVFSRVINTDYPIIFETEQIKNYWDPYHDQYGHGTILAAFAAGKTLGIVPNAQIQNLKTFTANVYDCAGHAESAYNGTEPAEWCKVSHPNAFQRAVEFAIRESATLRQYNLGPAVFMSASVPRATYNGTALPGKALQDKLTNSFKELIATGVMVVTAFSNAMYRLDNADDLRVKANEYAPWIWLPEMIIVGGIDRDYQQAIWTYTGYDDTWWPCECNYRLKSTGGSSFGDAFDFYAPAYGFASTARSNIWYTYDNNWPQDQPYWRGPLHGGTSYALGPVAGGVLAYLSTLDNPWTDTTPLETINTLKRHASNHTVRMFEMPPGWEDCDEPTSTCGTLCELPTCNPNAPDRPKAFQAIDHARRVFNAVDSGSEINMCWLDLDVAETFDSAIPMGDYVGWFDIQVLKLVPATRLNATRFCSL